MIAVLGWALCGVLLLNAAAALLAAALRLRTAAIPAEAPALPAQPAAGVVPFFSIHVPAHDEPPELLIGTLEALARLDWPAFEVLVIDNNTPDPETWQPVAAHCARLGPRFRFVHRDGVVGAKAGALNIALAMTDARATHIAVVDADYRVTPDFLREAAARLAAHGADYVQFPQAYAHGPAANPVACELGDYFRAHAASANASRSMLLTGTLSVLARPWLEQVGGWPTATITEDADLGLSLYRAGARGLYVDRLVGAGMLPLDFAGLALQRQRWVAGNVQTLLRGLRAGLARERAGLHSVLTQLLAWPAFAALPVLALLASGVLRGLGLVLHPWPIADGLAVTTLAVTLAALLIEFGLIKRQPAVLPVKLALLWTASLAWLPLLWGRRPGFRRTPKGNAGSVALPDQMAWGGVVLIGGAALQSSMGAPLAALALLAPLISLPAAALVDAALRAGPRQKAASAVGLAVQQA